MYSRADSLAQYGKDDRILRIVVAWRLYQPVPRRERPRIADQECTDLEGAQTRPETATDNMTLIESRVRSCTGKLAFISGPDDFSLEPGREVDSARMFDQDVSPYCFDLAGRSLICVSTPDISDAVFFYRSQREYARSVIRIPFASLPEGPASPALIFSIGRCGSTLLVKALRAAGVRTVSEPDFYTQAAGAGRDFSLRSAIGGATRLLQYPVIKLRLECNNAPLLIAGAFEAPRIMFILRNPLDWAASLRRLSRNSLDLDWAVAQLRRSLLALDELDRSYPVRICYYEDFRELDARQIAEVLAWTGSQGTVSQDVLRGIAATDAQDGTIVSRASVRDVPNDPAFRESFARAWSRWRPREAIDRLGLKLV
jgi:hypothetical protein